MFTFLQLQAKKSIDAGWQKSRFSNPHVRNIMSGILLVPGPVTTMRSLRGLSGVFNNAINKAKFLTAAKRLENGNLGRLVSLDRSFQSLNVFVKLPPEEMQPLLQIKENSDLCSDELYTRKYVSPSPATISNTIKKRLVDMGVVPQQVTLSFS